MTEQELSAQVKNVVASMNSLIRETGKAGIKVELIEQEYIMHAGKRIK